jgi:hypothetical protein
MPMSGLSGDAATAVAARNKNETKINDSATLILLFI